MGNKLKQTKPKGKLKPNNGNNKGDGSCHNDKLMPLFSFAYLTNNKNYSFEFWGDNYRNEITSRKSLEHLLKEVSSNTWLDLSKRNRRQFGGFEVVRYDEINFSPSMINLPKDKNIFSFRFGSADSCRLLGFKQDGCQALYIIGYDFDFSAYNHGS